MAESGGWFEDIAEAFQDAHEFVHDCAESYFDPELFRRNLNAYVQAARNITFRIQYHKDEIPDFERWYEPWQRYMKSNELLSWIVTARNTVTKRHGLRANSRATVRTITSYIRPHEEELEVDPTLPTPAIVEAALQRVPPKYRKYWTVEISRRWEIDDVPGKEVLAGLVEATRLYDALINDLLRFLDEGTAPLPGAAAFALPVRECMPEPRELHTAVFDPETRVRYERSEHWVDFNPEVADEAARTIGIPDDQLMRRMASPKLDELLEAHLDMAKLVLRGVGEFHPMVFLRQDGRWSMRMTAFIDKQQKYLTMHDIARTIRESGSDAIIMVAEAWTSSELPDTNTEYPEISDLPNRGESLVAYGADSSGYFRVIGDSFEDCGGKLIFRRDLDSSNPTEGAAMWPVLQVWNLAPTFER